MCSLNSFTVKLTIIIITRHNLFLQVRTNDKTTVIITILHQQIVLFVSLAQSRLVQIWTCFSTLEEWDTWRYVPYPQLLREVSHQLCTGRTVCPQCRSNCGRPTLFRPSMGSTPSGPSSLRSNVQLLLENLFQTFSTEYILYSSCKVVTSLTCMEALMPRAHGCA